MCKYLISILFILVNYVGITQCNIQASICQQGTAGPFNFTTTSGQYAGGSFANAGCATGNSGNHAYGFITLYITQSGPLNLLIDGNSTAGYIDVAIFNIPQGESPCNAIQNGANAIGCNFASEPGGCVQFGNIFPCGSTVPPPNVVAGQQIMIIVQNWSTPGSNNFTLQLGPTPGAQTGTPNTTINPINSLCTTSSPIQLTAINGGGTWSGPGVSPTGLFNPSLVGVGSHLITYSLGVAPCNSTSSIQVVVNEPPILNITATNVSCNGNCDGSIDVNLIPNGIYSYTGGNLIGGGGFETNTITNLCSGNYTINVTQNGCQSTGTVVVTELDQPTINGPIGHN